MEIFNRWKAAFSGNYRFNVEHYNFKGSKGYKDLHPDIKPLIANGHKIIENGKEQCEGGSDPSKPEKPEFPRSSAQEQGPEVDCLS